MRQKWYQKTWGIIVLLWLFFPVGLYVMWRHASWRPQIKWAISGGLAILLVIVIVASSVSGGSDDGDSSQVVGDEGTPAQSNPTATEVSEPDEMEATATPPPDPTEAPQQVGSYSLLAIDDVEVSGANVTISGRTDLPTGAVVTVGFDVWGRADTDLYIGVDERVEVTNREFVATLGIPQRTEYVTGPYEVSVLFTPRGQSESVLELVGMDGQNLSGEFVGQSFNFAVLDMVEQVDVQLSVSPPSYVFQPASDFPLGSAEQTLANWVAAWRDQDWQRMANLSQLTWVDVEPDSVGILEAWYGFKTLKGFEVKEIDRISEVASDVTFVVHYEAFINQIDKKEITAKVIKETAPYNPSPQGEWGVNPISALAETDLE